LKKEMIVRAWKDPEFRAGLSPEERATLPECPSGRPMTELDEGELLHAAGGRPQDTAPIVCCPTMNAICTARQLCGGFD
jgi:mersacidin/lichenicidin family type 2 lantibiotic